MSSASFPKPRLSRATTKDVPRTPPRTSPEVRATSPTEGQSVNCASRSAPRTTRSGPSLFE